MNEKNSEKLMLDTFTIIQVFRDLKMTVKNVLLIEKFLSAKIKWQIFLKWNKKSQLVEIIKNIIEK